MEQPKRKGQKAGSRTEFTCIARVKPGQEKAVRAAMLSAPYDERQRAVDSLGIMHEARFVLFDNDTRVLFCSSFDGTWDHYIDDFSTVVSNRIFNEVFSCTGSYSALS